MPSPLRSMPRRLAFPRRLLSSSACAAGTATANARRVVLSILVVNLITRYLLCRGAWPVQPVEGRPRHQAQRVTAILMPQESIDFGEYRGRAAGFIMAPGEGFEPPTNRLTADRSTTELPRNRWDRKTPRNSRKAKNLKAFAARLSKPAPDAGPRDGQAKR